MTKFTLTNSKKLTRSELAQRLRVRADQLENKNIPYAGELYVDEKGTAEGGVDGAFWKITGLKKE